MSSVLGLFGSLNICVFLTKRTKYSFGHRSLSPYPLSFPHFYGFLSLKRHGDVLFVREMCVLSFI